jgi:hypothetical protein
VLFWRNIPHSKNTIHCNNPGKYHLYSHHSEVSNSKCGNLFIYYLCFTFSPHCLYSVHYKIIFQKTVDHSTCFLFSLNVCFEITVFIWQDRNLIILWNALNNDKINKIDLSILVVEQGSYLVFVPFSLMFIQLCLYSFTFFFAYFAWFYFAMLFPLNVLLLFCMSFFDHTKYHLIYSYTVVKPLFKKGERNCISTDQCPYWLHSQKSLKKLYIIDYLNT